ncbi:hypothetical protein DY000_02016541 [Brassica cretica]|uniref:Aminotransferase-like plant mobile domain-containing protein n=1 Tax=Brassica cretica TaxID=69181 RepID=A0ABQ7CXH8_BRACR|nr:hypothetical protein DY000_02016541 [Brassica cretica]
MSSSFSFPRPTTTTDDLEDLYTVYEVDRAVVLDLASASETPETVRGGYYGAYLSFFQSCGPAFPIPEPLLEILAELGLSFTQILPNFLRHLTAFLVRAREEGLSFGLSEFCHLFLVKRNKQSPGTFLVSPRPGRHAIEDVPYCDEKWRKQFLVFKVDRASMCDFDFSRLPWNWAENIVHSGSSLMSGEIRGLIRVLWRGGTNRTQPVIGSSEDEAERSQEVIATSSTQAQSLDRLARQLIRRSSFRTSGSASRSRASDRPSLNSIRDSDDNDVPGERRSPVSLSLGSKDEDDMISLAGRMRSAGCRLPSLTSSTEKLAYAKVVVASSKVVAQRARIVALEVERDRDIRRVSRVARRDVAGRCREILESLKEKWANKKKEAPAKIQLQEVVANINLLNELKDGGLNVDAELARLKEMKKDCEGLVVLAASVEARLRVVSNERKSALEQALADSYLDVLVSLKEKWEKKKAATDREAHLREVMANIDLLKEIMDNNLLASDELLRLRTKEVELGSEVDVMAVSDFSVEKLDLPHIMEDLPEDFFAKVPSVMNDRGDETECEGGHFKDGEFDVEE